MKKAFVSLTLIFLSFLFVFQTTLVAFADQQPDWRDAELTQQEINDIYALNPASQISTYATGLIVSYRIAIGASGNNLQIVGQTLGDVGVIKAGFTVVTVKRRLNSGASWTTYKTYNDLYNNYSAYSLGKTLTVPSGWQWRVYCTHYAKKNLLSTQKIDNTSNVLYIA